MYASKIEFGAGAFETAAQGLLVLGRSASAGIATCSTICSNHGLACTAAYTLAGYCGCG